MHLSPLAYPTEARDGWVEWPLWTRLPAYLGGIWPPRPAVLSMTQQERLEAGIELYDTVTDEVPEGKVATAWTLTDVDGAPHWTPTLEDELIDAVRARALSAIEQRLVAEMAAGAPYGELHIALHDGSRADLSGMAATAIAAAAGQVPWPAEYAQGWISIENVRIPLDTPADGLALAAAVGQRYAALRQAARTLKDAVLAAEDAAAVAAIDLEAGWPAAPED